GADAPEPLDMPVEAAAAPHGGPAPVPTAILADDTVEVAAASAQRVGPPPVPAAKQGGASPSDIIAPTAPIPAPHRDADTAERQVEPEAVSPPVVAPIPSGGAVAHRPPPPSPVVVPALPSPARPVLDLTTDTYGSMATESHPGIDQVPWTRSRS